MIKKVDTLQVISFFFFYSFASVCLCGGSVPAAGTQETQFILPSDWSINGYL